MGGSSRSHSTWSRLAPVTLVGLLLATAACGGSSKPSSSNVISAGQVDIQLPPGWKVTKNGAVRPPAALTVGNSPAPPGATTAGGRAVPLPKVHPTPQFLKPLTTY